MDPLSITASAIAIIQISGTIINTCYTYRSRLKSASKDASRIINELNALRTIIEDLYQLLYDENETKAIYKSTLSKLSQPDGILATCLASLEELSKKLEPKEGWKATKAAILWPLKESDMTRALQDISITKDTVQLALAADQRKATAVIQNSVLSLVQQVSDDGLAARRDKMYRWLDAPNAIASHTRARKKCQKMTGKWLVNGDQFGHWSKSPHSFLWIYGIPGCGKTILCSTVIEELSTRCQSSSTTALAYFYFDFNEPKKSKADAFVRSIITQLLFQNTAAFIPIEKLFKQNNDGAFQPTLQDLLSALSQMVSGFGGVYLVIDALDESTELEDMLKLISDIRSWDEDHMHIIVTSRLESKIEDLLSTAATASLCLDEFVMAEDLSFYIASQLKEDSKLARWPPDVQETIRHSLVKDSRGMFRWTVYQLDTLKRCLTIINIKKQLKSLPKTLDETYDQILLRIDETYRENALRVLQFLAFAARPVTFVEAAEILTIDLDQECYDPHRKLLNPDDLMLLCSTLVTRASISEVDFKDVMARTFYCEYYFEYTDCWMIRLAYLSVKDCLLSDRIKSSRLSHFALEAKLANSLIAQVCVAYMMHLPFTKACYDWDILQTRLNDWPSYHYAVHHWPYHVKLCGEPLDDKTWKLLQRFFETRKLPENGNYGAWVTALVPGVKNCHESEPLYYSASFGVPSVIKRILESDPPPDIDKPGGRFLSSPLQVATFRNHPDAVKILLEAGANPNAVNQCGQSQLFWAIGGELGECRTLLESYGATLTELDIQMLDDWDKGLLTGYDTISEAEEEEEGEDVSDSSESDYLYIEEI